MQRNCVFLGESKRLYTYSEQRQCLFVDMDKHLFQVILLPQKGRSKLLTTFFVPLAEGNQNN